MEGHSDSKLKKILVELAHHLPYSVFGVSTGIILMGLLTFFVSVMGREIYLSEASGELFHVFHSCHILFSAVATTAMFWKHEKRLVKAILVGFFGSITICGVSDIFFPYIGGMILGSEMHMHICLIEEPGLILPFAFVGVIAGILVTQSLEKSTEYSHSVHVFVSSVASILYLLSYGLTDWTHVLGGVFMVTIFAVMIPCCASDIAFPLVCIHRNCNHD